MEEIKGIKTGHAQNTEGGSGCNAIICEKGAFAGVDVREGGPASRETDVAPDSLGALATEVMGRAINRAVRKAESAYGFIAACDIK